MVATCSTPYAGVDPYVQPSLPQTTSELVPLLKARDVEVLLDLTESALGHLRFRGEGPVWIQIGRSIRYSREMSLIGSFPSATVPAAANERGICDVCGRR